MASCWSGRMERFGIKPPEGACVAATVDNSIYCAHHLAEALERVEMVRDDDPKPWHGILRESKRKNRHG